MAWIISKDGGSSYTFPYGPSPGGYEIRERPCSEFIPIDGNTIYQVNYKDNRTYVLTWERASSTIKGYLSNFSKGDNGTIQNTTDASFEINDSGFYSTHWHIQVTNVEITPLPESRPSTRLYYKCIFEFVKTQ